MGKKEVRKERKKERKREKERKNYYKYHLCLLLSNIWSRSSKKISVSTEIYLDTSILPVFYGPDFKRKNKFCRGGI